jgi:hypothetical protein
MIRFRSNDHHVGEDEKASTALKCESNRNEPNVRRRSRGDYSPRLTPATTGAGGVAFGCQYNEEAIRQNHAILYTRADALRRKLRSSVRRTGGLLFRRA